VCVRVMVPFAALHFQLSTCRRMTVLVERGTSACENKDQHVKTKRRWGVSWRKVIFPVCLCSITCSQTRHVDSMFDEDRHTASWHTVVPFAGWKALVVKARRRRPRPYRETGTERPSTTLSALITYRSLEHRISVNALSSSAPRVLSRCQLRTGDRQRAQARRHDSV